MLRLFAIEEANEADDEVALAADPPELSLPP
jgi:hypothetical protein